MPGHGSGRSGEQTVTNLDGRNPQDVFCVYTVPVCAILDVRFDLVGRLVVVADVSEARFLNVVGAGAQWGDGDLAYDVRVSGNDLLRTGGD